MRRGWLRKVPAHEAMGIVCFALGFLFIGPRFCLVTITVATIAASARAFVIVGIECRLETSCLKNDSGVVFIQVIGKG